MQFCFEKRNILLVFCPISPNGKIYGENPGYLFKLFFLDHQHIYLNQGGTKYPVWGIGYWGVLGWDPNTWKIRKSIGVGPWWSRAAKTALSNETRGFCALFRGVGAFWCRLWLFFENFRHLWVVFENSKIMIFFWKIHMFFENYIFVFFTRDHVGSTQLLEWNRFRTLINQVEGK